MNPYYEDESVKIFHGCSLEILPTIGEFDLLLSDPPYGTEGLTGGYGRAQNHGGGRTIQGDKDLDMFNAVMGLAGQQMSPHSWACAFAAARRMPEAIAMASALGFEWFGEFVWDKASPGMGFTIRYQHESCMVFRRGEPARPARAPISVVRYPVSHVDTAIRHPHEKPVDFWQNCLWLPGVLAVDPFCGTGNMLRVAKNLGRKAIGIEREEKWCEAAARNMQQQVFAL